MSIKIWEEPLLKISIITTEMKLRKKEEEPLMKSKLISTSFAKNVNSYSQNGKKNKKETMTSIFLKDKRKQQ
jgi:hypothetical protein